MKDEKTIIIHSDQNVCIESGETGKKYTKSSRSSFNNDSALHMQITWLKNIYSGNTFLNFIALPEPIDSKPYE